MHHWIKTFCEMKSAFPWKRTGRNEENWLYLKYITSLSYQRFCETFNRNFTSCRDGSLPNRTESPTPLSPQNCLLGSSLSQDLVTDRIHSSPLYIHITHGSHLCSSVKCRLKVCTEARTLPVNPQRPFLSNWRQAQGALAFIAWIILWKKCH